MTKFQSSLISLVFHINNHQLTLCKRFVNVSKIYLHHMAFYGLSFIIICDKTRLLYSERDHNDT